MTQTKLEYYHVNLVVTVIELVAANNSEKGHKLPIMIEFSGFVSTLNTKVVMGVFYL